jgi:hypothetical protein
MKGFFSGKIYKQVPAEEDNLKEQTLLWLKSMRCGDYRLGSPRRSSVMRRAWKSGALGTIRVWLDHIKITEGEDKQLRKDVYRVVYRATAKAVDGLGLGPEDTADYIEAQVREKFPGHWGRAQELWRANTEEVKRRKKKVDRGLVLPTIKLSEARRGEARLRANDRMYRPGGTGFEACKDRFETFQHVVLADTRSAETRQSDKEALM